MLSLLPSSQRLVLPNDVQLSDTMNEQNSEFPKSISLRRPATVFFLANKEDEDSPKGVSKVG